MSDISMCKKEDCLLKDSCYRFQAESNEYWQSYADFKYPCEYYWPIKIEGE